MSVTNADLVLFASNSMPEDDTSTSGGAIDTTTKILLADIAANDNVTIISTDAGDTTQTITITGRDAAGVIVNESLSLNGTTRVVGSQVFERILKVVCNAAHSGQIIITRDDGPTYTQITTLETGYLARRRLFYDASSDISGGSTRDYYEKIFLKNTNSTTALTNAFIREYADPSTFITFDLESSKGGSNSVVNRLTAPTGMLGSFDNTDKDIPSGYLANGEAIGIWLKLTLAAGTSPAKTTWTPRVIGSTI